MNEFYKMILREDLYKYNILRNSLDNVKDEINELENRKLPKISVSYGSAPTSGGGSCYEDTIININAKLEMLKNNYYNGASLCNRMDKAFLLLSDMEKDIVISINANRRKRNGNISKLEKKYNFSKSEIYRKHDEALDKLSLSLYGDN